MPEMSTLQDIQRQKHTNINKTKLEILTQIMNT